MKKSSSLADCSTDSYFFHATSARRETQDYQLSDNIDRQNSHSPTSTDTLGTPEAQNDDDELPTGISASKAQTQSKLANTRAEDAESETEPDSDNEDVNDPEIPLDDDDETWSQIGDQDARCHFGQSQVRLDQSLRFPLTLCLECTGQCKDGRR